MAWFSERSVLHRYAVAIRATPRQVFSLQLLLTVTTFAIAGCPKGWDEGSAASITQLTSFRNSFHLNSGNAVQDSNTISNLVSLVNLGAGIGPLLSLPFNDILGRIWSYRLWMLVYGIGIILEVFAGSNLNTIYAGRIIAGFGIGALTVIGPMGIAEYVVCLTFDLSSAQPSRCAPRSLRGLLGLSFNVCMIGGQVIGIFVVYGVQQSIPASRSIQWQLPFIVQLAIPVLGFALSFLVPESPRFLLGKGKEASAVQVLCRLRNLPEDAPYVLEECAAMKEAHSAEEIAKGGSGFLGLLKECFTVRNYFRRTRTVIIAYVLAQFSGANSITNYLPTILTLLGVTNTNQRLLYTAGYSIAKLGCLFIASLFFVDLVGRRKSLLVGVTVQGLCHVYLAVYLHRYLGGGSVTRGSSDMAIAAIFIHAFGWGIGLLPLPYLFGAELFPTRIRSVGGALSASFHWLFYFAITKATPAMLTAMNGWGLFAFFAAWCAIAWVYGFIMIPETAGRSLESINALFDIKWYEIRKNAYPTDEDLMAPVVTQATPLSNAENGDARHFAGDLVLEGKSESEHREYSP
ncbi:hypothetical protein JCM24511_03743 [Saitozyma sp. JCM 24511]|nr:hypothetical protein JCM24511_03743 [Saitozyma sp. JCM 24511]